MVRLKEQKQTTETRAIEKLSSCSRVYLPLSQHLGKPATPIVKPGDAVSLGQKIAVAQTPVSAPIHASLSGKVVAIEKWPHPILGRLEAIVIETDGLDSPSDLNPQPQAQIDKLEPEEIRKIVQEAGVVGMGGAGFPTYIKLNPPHPPDTLIINGAECEPYLTSDYRLMIEKREEILKGIRLVARCLNVKNVYIAIEDNKPEAIKGFRLQASGFRLKILPRQYPQGGEKQLIKNILKREVPQGKLPFDVGVVVHNVGTAFAIYEAVYLGKPLYERVVTVTGSCLANPKNLLVRLGTPLKELIQFCGPLEQEPAKIIFGGPMMGIAQYTDEVPVIKCTSGVILFSAKEAKIQQEEPCIRCGACIRECPVGLLPCLINLAAENQDWTKAKSYFPLDCIECGLCNYVCPAKRRLTQSIKRAKLEVAK